MYVCICQSVSDHAIREAVAEGVRSFEELQACTGCSTGCGCCETEARRVFNEAVAASCLDLRLTVAA
jgi:bacterioferritin-associated ferredoxin